MKKTGTIFAGQLIALAAISMLSTFSLTQSNNESANVVSSVRQLSRVYNPNRGWSSASTYRMAPDYFEYSTVATAPRIPDLSGVSANDYLPSISSEGAYTWQADKLPIKVYVGSGANVPGYRPQWRSYFANCFDQWCQASQGKLSWVEVSNPSQADISIGWTSNVTERPEGTEAGKTSAFTRLNTQTNKGIIYGAKMQLLTRLPDRDFSDNEVFKTILHETGHALGLQGHSPTRTDIMYYAVNPNQQPILSSRDKNTLVHLYADYPATADAVALGRKVRN